MYTDKSVKYFKAADFLGQKIVHETLISGKLGVSGALLFCFYE